MRRSLYLDIRHFSRTAVLHCVAPWSLRARASRLASDGTGRAPRPGEVPTGTGFRGHGGLACGATRSEY